MAYTFAGYYVLYGTTHQKLYSDDDMECTGILREFLITDII